MSNALLNRIRKDVCPNNTWDLTDVMRSLLRYQIGRLPRKRVSETETRYPVTPAGMRAFLEVFFTRHFFQVQNSLIHYLTSYDGIGVIRSGSLRILDIGSGPAVASLAITDMVACVLKNLADLGAWPRNTRLRLTYVLNDTVSICLGTGQSMLGDYFRISGGHRKWITHARMVSVQKAFPDNIRQLRRIAHNIGGYDIAAFSYVLTPLKEDAGLDHVINGLSTTKNLCNSDGRILILQDRFKATLVQRVGTLIGTSSRKEELTQRVNPRRNENKIYTYSYYSCLCSPTKGGVVRKSVVL